MELRDFVQSLHFLFVDQYVLCLPEVQSDPPGPDARPVPVKTITQIVMAQCEEP